MSPKILAASCLALLLASLAAAPAFAEAGFSWDEKPTPYTRKVGVDVPFSLGLSLTDLVSTPDTNYLNTGMDIGSGVDLVFSRIFEWDLFDYTLLYSTGFIETPQTFRQYALIQVASTPAINIPVSKYGTTVLHLWGGPGYSQAFAGSFAGGRLPRDATPVLEAGIDVAGFLGGPKSGWRYQGFGLNYIRYYNNSPVSNVFSILVNMHIYYDFSAGKF